jgi:hypothetical protein
VHWRKERKPEDKFRMTGQISYPAVWTWMRRRHSSEKEFSGEFLHKIKMRQAGVCACLIIRCFYLVVELQRKPNVSRWLRSLDHPRR